MRIGLNIMRLSELFTKTRREFPKDEESTNAKLLIKGGFVQKMSAGVYSYLPLGWRVLQKINGIVREEMNAIGGMEILMPALIAKEYWEKTNRWNEDVVYKVKHEVGGEFGLGWTQEEVVTDIATNYIHSYKDLPYSVYQIQTKFRAEPRAKSGLLRGREFLMKDMYSFHSDEEDLKRFYKTVDGAYKKVLTRLELDARIVEAGGGSFTNEFTHEYQVLHPVGEDSIYYCKKCDFARNKEIFSEAKCPKCGATTIEGRGIEIANIFKLGTRFSDAYNLHYASETGEKKSVVMGCYGFGPSRALGTIVEVFNDEKGIMWPESIAPYKFHLIDLKNKRNSEKVYGDLIKRGAEVLYDDRDDASAGEKFSDADLLGIPIRIVVSEKSGDKIEIKERKSDKTKLGDIEDLDLSVT